MFLNCKLNVVEIQGCKSVGNFDHMTSVEKKSKMLNELKIIGCNMKQVKFYECDILMYVKECNLAMCKFILCDLESFNMNRSKCIHIRIEDCTLYYCGLEAEFKLSFFKNNRLNESSKIFDINEIKGDYLGALITYDNLYKEYRNNNEIKLAYRYFTKHKKFERKSSKGIDKIGKYLLYFMWGDGESLIHLVSSALIMIIVFGILYTYSGVQNNSLAKTSIDTFYFSVVTFTSLGYGDMAPSSLISKIFVMIEVVWGLGYIVLTTACIYKKITHS